MKRIGVGPKTVIHLGELAMKLKSIAVAAVVAVASSAYAGPVLFPGLNLLEDDNREFLIKGEGNIQAGILEVGDKLRGVIQFAKIEEVNGTGEQNPIVPQLTGLFETEVKSIVGLGSLPNPNIALRIDFGPSSAFESDYGPGAMAAIFAGSSLTSLNACTSITQCETDASDGALWAVAGFADGDDEWFSTLSNVNFGQVATLSASTKVAFVNYALSLLVNNTGYLFNEIALDCTSAGGPFTCADDGKTHLVGSGDALGGASLTNGYQARSDFDVLLNRAVPEPGSLALLGLALAGLGAATRTRRA